MKDSQIPQDLYIVLLLFLRKNNYKLISISRHIEENPELILKDKPVTVLMIVLQFLTKLKVLQNIGKLKNENLLLN